MSRVAQSTALARRSLVATVRQPQLIVPSLVFPLLFCALNSASLQRTTQLPGFPPVDSYLTFLLATTIIQGVLFGASSAGNDMAIDIETKFLDRLVASPVSRPAILVGRVAGAAAFGMFQAVLFLVILVPFGASVAGGVGAVAVIVASAALLAAGVGALSVALAIRTGSAEAVQGFFPLFFAFLFFSSAFFPRELMSGWFKTVATINPLSWLIESLRSLVIGGFDAAPAARAVAIPAVLFVAANLLAAAALRARIAAA